MQYGMSVRQHLTIGIATLEPEFMLPLQSVGPRGSTLFSFCTRGPSVRWAVPTTMSGTSVGTAHLTKIHSLGVSKNGTGRIIDRDASQEPSCRNFSLNRRTTPGSIPTAISSRPSRGCRETFIAEGEKLVLRLLDSPCSTESILCTAAVRDRLAERLPADIPIYVTTTPVISGLIGFQFHRGILACGRRPP